MLISDWSSDVCSSDLGLVEGFLTRTIRSWRPPLHHSALPNGPAPRSGEVFGRASSPRVVHRRAHPADAVGKPDEDRPADQKMADIEFAHLPDRGVRPDIVLGEAVAGTIGRAPAGERVRQ